MPNETTSKMTQVVVSKFPVALREHYQKQADKNGRSLAAEIRIVLAERVGRRRMAKAA